MAQSHKVVLRFVTKPLPRCSKWTATLTSMASLVPIAPRYDPFVVKLAYVLDDPTQPIAETCRAVGAAAERLGLFRPSYPHIRRFVAARRRAEARRRAFSRAQRAAIIAVGGATSVYLARRARRSSSRRRDFVAQSHKLRRTLARLLAPD